LILLRDLRHELRLDLMIETLGIGDPDGLFDHLHTSRNVLFELTFGKSRLISNDPFLPTYIAEKYEFQS